jgi:ketosteroid isomerase-like protein
MTRELTRRVFDAVDTLDSSALTELFAHDGSLVFANGEPLVGRDAIRTGIDAFYSTIKGLRHRIANAWHLKDTTIVEARVTYDRLDGDSVTIPVVSIWHRRDDGLIDHYRVYFDVTPLYEPTPDSNDRRLAARPGDGEDVVQLEANERGQRVGRFLEG